MADEVADRTDPSPAAATEPVLLRRKVQYVISIIALAIFLVPLLFGFLGFLITRTWVGAAVLVGPTVFLARAMWGQVHVGVWVDRDGLTLRQLFRTRRIRWSDVDRISPATEDWQKYVGIVLEDGRRIRCAALGAGRGERSARLDPYVRTLNDLFSTARQSAG